MVVLSKEMFYSVPSDIRKCDLLHVWYKSCLSSNLYFLKKMSLGSSRFFIPLYIVKLMLSYNKINKTFLKGFMISFCRSFLYGQLYGNLILATYCVVTHTVGRIDYYSLALLPGFVSGLSLLAAEDDSRVLNTITFFNMVVESAINNLHYFNIFKFTKIRQTLLFALSSSALMYLLQNRKEKITFSHFWFYTPQRRKSEIETGKCYHEESCNQYWKNGFLRYLTIGYSFGIIKRLIPNMNKLLKSPKQIFTILFHKSNVRLGLFVGSYITLYRIINCYLLKKDKYQKSNHAAIAGLLSGFSYMIEPNIQFLIIAITTTLQMLYHNIRTHFNIPSSLIPQQLLYMCCNAILFHNRLMCPESTPRFYSNLLRIASVNIMDDIYDHAIKTFVNN